MSITEPTDHKQVKVITQFRTKTILPLRFSTDLYIAPYEFRRVRENAIRHTFGIYSFTIVRMDVRTLRPLCVFDAARTKQ